MNYDWLFSFTAFAEDPNFTRVAKRLHMTQPALHAQIRKLSDDVGTALYMRDGRALVVTEEGRRLAAFGREVQLRGRDVLAELRGEVSPGPVVLVSGQGAFLYLLGPAIQRFPKERWPLRVLSMSGPDAVKAVRDARADVGVAVLAHAPVDLDCRELCRVGQRVLVPRGHRLVKRRTLRPRDLDSESLIVAPEGSPHRVMLAQALATAGAKWTVAVEATGWDLMSQFARCGLGLAVVNDFCPVPSGLVGIKLEDVPDVAYQVLTRRGARRESRDILVRMIFDAVRTGAR